MSTVLPISEHLTETEQMARAMGVSPAAPARAAQSEAEPKEHTFVIDDEAENIRSYLAEGETIEGNLRLKYGIRVAGVIDGRVQVANGTVIVEKTGVVTGGIEANNRIIVDGTVGSEERIECTDQSQPTIRTPGLLAVMGTGRVLGCYQYGRIATYDDATLEGMGKKFKG